MAFKNSQKAKIINITLKHYLSKTGSHSTNPIMLVYILTWWRTVASDMMFPLTKVFAFSIGVMLTVP